MARLLKFQTPYGTYTFPTFTGQALDDNFKDLLARTTRLPGVDGGLDEFGSGRAPSAVGNVSYSFVLVSTTREGMQAKLDELGQMAGWGVGSLWYQPTDAAQATRWTWARVNRISDPQRLEGHSDLFMRVSVNFQASSPFWYGRGTELLWDDGAVWDGASTNWDGNTSAPALASVTDASTVTVSGVGGNVPTLARLLVIKDTAGAVLDPLIERLDGSGAVVDWVQWSGELTNGQFLEIDPRRQKVIKVSANVRSGLSFMNPDWMTLRPGSNTLRVRWQGTAKLGVRWLERYK